MVGFGCKPLDRRNGLTLCRLHRSETASGSFTVYVDCAGAAKAHAASVLRSGQSEFVSQVPQQRHVGIAVDLLGFSIYIQSNHDCSVFRSARLICWRTMPRELIAHAASRPAISAIMR